MANEVYANGREVSCKAADGKSICAFPDVCLSPPSPPAGPIPIPYPNTAFASDTTSGSKTVKISNKEVMLKDKSYFKKSTGDEAATKTLGMGVVTHQITGKVYFTSWSMDVKVEGENVVRMLDLTTHNHMSVPGNSPPWPYIDAMAVDADVPDDHPCKGDAEKEKKACKEFTPYGSKDACAKKLLGDGKPSGKADSPEADKLADKTAANDCLAARRCSLKPYKSAKSGCCPQQTGHHLIEASALHEEGRGGPGCVAVKGVHDYSENMAPCVCAEGVNQNVGTHGLMHAFQSASAASAPTGDVPLSNQKSLKNVKKTTYGTAKKKAIEAMQKTFPDSKCDPKCIESQLDAYHNQCGIDDKTTIKAVETGGITESEANQAVADRATRVAAARGAGGSGSR